MAEASRAAAVTRAYQVDNGGEDGLLVFNVGDSRCYAMVDSGRLVQITTDHSVVQEMVDDGEITPDEARHHPSRNVVTRAIGVDERAFADFVVATISERVRFHLCSDGVSGELEDDEIEQLVRTTGPPEGAALRIVERVLEGSARDNVTAVVVDVERLYAADERPGRGRPIRIDRASAGSSLGLAANARSLGPDRIRACHPGGTCDR